MVRPERLELPTYWFEARDLALPLFSAIDHVLLFSGIYGVA